MGKKKCGGCSKMVSPMAAIKCLGCSLYYHHLCVLQGDEVPGSWRCPNCKVKLCQMNPEPAYDDAAGSAALDSSSVLAAAADCPVFVPASLAAAAAPISTEQDNADGIPFSPDIDMPLILTSPDVHLIHCDLQTMKEHLMLVQDDVRELSDAYNERIDGLEQRMQSLENWISVMEEERINKDISLEMTISQLRQEMNELDQDVLVNDVDISGIPEADDENVFQIVLTIAKKLAVPLDLKDIVHAERVGLKRSSMEDGKPPKPRAIAVRLARRSCRDALLREARLRRENTTADLGLAPPKKYYINERLTKYNRALFFKVKEVADDLSWKYLWTRDGRIFARKDDGHQKHRIRSEVDIGRVFDVVIDSE